MAYNRTATRKKNMFNSHSDYSSYYHNEMDVIQSYARFKHWKWPGPLDAFLFALTEFGEVLEIKDGYILLDTNLAFEIGDVYMMAKIASQTWVKNPSIHYSDDERNHYSLNEIFIVMSKILDAYLRTDGEWARNNEKELSMDWLFARFFYMLDRYSMFHTGNSAYSNMLQKMKSKGFEL